MSILFANNALSTLAGAISNVATSATLAPGTGTLFPNPSGGDYFLLTFTDAATGLVNEIVKVTARSGDAITIVRAQEGTAAAAWSAGDNASLLITAGALGAFFQGSTALPPYVAGGTANVLTLTPTPAIGAYLDGQTWNVEPSANNTGAATINISGLGAKSIVNNDGSALVAGALPSGGLVQIIYDAALGKFVLATGYASAVKYLLTGASPFATVSVTGNATFGGTLGVTGAATLSSTLNVADTATFNKVGGNAINIPNGSTITMPGVTVAPDSGSGSILTLTGFLHTATYNWAGITGDANFQVVAGGSGGVILNNGATAWAAISDYRAKILKGAYLSSGTIIDAVPVYLAAMKYTPEVEKAMFVAHEVQAAVPYAVSGEKDGEEMQTLHSTDPLVPILWAEVRALRARIAALETARR